MATVLNNRQAPSSRPRRSKPASGMRWPTKRRTRLCCVAASCPQQPRASRSWEPEIDSLVAVEVICAVEELLGIELPATFSPKGGYANADACVNDLIAEAKVVWTEATKEKETHEQ